MMAPKGARTLTRRQLGTAALAAAGAFSLPRWLRAASERTGLAEAPMTYFGPDTLRAHATSHGIFYGAAIVPELLDVDGFAAGTTADAYTCTIAGQCNIVVGENAMKWKALRPTATTFDFTQADKLLRFAELASQRVRGHNLCWHEALPQWFQATATKDNARKLLTDHINAVAGRYRGRIHSWDVVNEAIDTKSGRGDGLRKSSWLDLIGADYIELAFTTAAQADPAAKLTYNEYGIELDTPDETVKRAQTLILLRRLKARNIPIHAVGIQSHLQATQPFAGPGLVAFIREVKALGLEVYITELDVNTHKLDGAPELQDAAVAQVYRDFPRLVLPEPNVQAVLTWGITSAHTFINVSTESWNRRPDGARQRPLPFDDNYQPTPAFAALRDAIDAARPLTAPQPASTTPTPTAKPDELYKPFTVPGSPTVQPQ